MTDNQMTDEPQAKVVKSPRPYRRPWSRAAGFLRRQRELRIEDILKAAKKGQLDHLLGSYYTVYSDPSWREKIQLCRDLADSGLLQAKFQADMDGATPIFLMGNRG